VVADTLSDIPIADDWLDALFTATKGRISYLSINIAAARRRAKASRWEVIDLSRWGTKLFVVGR
jgi:hypothetical protein